MPRPQVRLESKCYIILPGCTRQGLVRELSGCDAYSGRTTVQWATGPPNSSSRNNAMLEFFIRFLEELLDFANFGNDVSKLKKRVRLQFNE